MLQAKRKITKKELKKDPLLESLSQSKSFYNSKKSIINKVGLILVLAIIVSIIISKRIQSNHHSAEEAFGKALISMTSGDEDNGILQLELLIDSYSGTDAAQRSAFLLGKRYYEKGDLLTSTSYLDEYLEEPENQFHDNALFLKASIEKESGNINQYEQLIQSAIKKANNQVEKDYYRISLAHHYMNTLNFTNAKDIAAEIHENYERRSNLFNQADEILGRLQVIKTEVQ